MKLSVLGESLKAGFGTQVDVELLQGELKLTIGGKAVWLDADGMLTGESGIGPRSFLIGVDIDRAFVAPTGAAIASSV